MDNTSYPQNPQYGMQTNYGQDEKSGAPPAQSGYYPPAGQPPQYNAPPAGTYPPPAGGAYPAAPVAYPQAQYGQGQPVNVVYANDEVANVSDYCIANILACIFCCWCIGIAAIIKSNECQDAKRARDLPRAKETSDSAKKLLIATVVCGIVIMVIGIIARVVLTVAVTTNNNNY